MSYEPTNWKTGDVVTSAKLNKLENGVAQSGSTGNLIVHLTETEEDAAIIKTMDKTWKDIRDAFVAGNDIYILCEKTRNNTTIYTRDTVVRTVESEMAYVITIKSFDSNDMGRDYDTNSENGYPQYTQNIGNQ